MTEHDSFGPGGVFWPEKKSNRKEIKKGDYVQCRLRHLLLHIVKVGIVSSDPDEDGYIQVLWIIDEESNSSVNEVTKHLPSFLEPIKPEDIKNIREKIQVKGIKSK